MGQSEFQAGRFPPVRLLETELSQPLALVPAGASATGAPYRRALALVRFHGQPLGLVELHLAGDGLGAADLASHIWRALEHQITEHLWQDGLPEVTGLDAAGFASAATPRCLQERAARLHALPF